MSEPKRSGRSVHVRYWLAAVIISTGVALCVVGFRLTGPDAPPRPPASVADIPKDASPNPELALPASVPKRIRIPSIKVGAPVVPVDVQPDGALGVPPLSRVDEVGWYRAGPTPGENGRSVLVGHVDSKKQPGVFYKLGALRQGRRIEVVREDGTTATFRVDGVKLVPKDRFPTKSVYGTEGGPELRLVTCGGRFNRKRGHYEDNIIVYASLTPRTATTHSPNKQ
ncbi:class F sortase [Actinomadura chibensis]|uniref:Class F sortase n=1 Tax=Actinomadura chibensis TaxID=392828 RepID=A0A5D0NYH2_9ACTN|nr:class F sortase [Actinomadura chibensis]TYB49526.1 class F sortase [Actinomadura chibensis]